MAPEQPDPQGPTFLRDLFGNPADETFLAWLADRGVGAIVVAAGAIALWLLVRWYLRRKFVASAAEERDVPGALSRADRIIASAVPAIIIAIAAGIGIAFVLGGDVGPAATFFSELGTDVLRWIFTSGLRIVLVVVLAWAGIRISRRVIPVLMLRFIRDSRDAADHAEASRKRAETLTTVFVTAINVIIVVSVVFIVLTELGAPIGPVLGGVGIAGIAIGFGAQHLVRDVITGTLILMENQYRQGDVVRIAGIAGLVESVNLRRTVLRDLEGRVHTIPHGQISTTTNFTKYWSRIILDVGVAYKENMDHVFRVLDEIGQELANHPEHGLKVIDPPKVLRLNSFDDSAITIRVLGVCKPLTQWELSGWMRKRIKERFDEEGIEIPFPHMSVYWGVDQPRLPWDGPPAENGKAESPVAATPPERVARVAPDRAAPEAEVAADDFVDPALMTPEQREAMLAEMALAAKAAQEMMLRDREPETRLPADES